MSGGTPDPGWYPQEAHYAPGWQAPVASTPPRPPRPVGKILLLVGIGVVVVAVAALVSVLVLRSQGARPLGDVDTPTTANARQLAVGHCVEELPDDGSVGRVRVVPCDTPHEAEVVGVHTFDDGEWPGERSVGREAAAACEMDTAQTEAGARPVVWAPTAQSWSQGDRQGLCLAWTPDAPRTGSWSG